ncbi:MAG: hypothetical protein AMXMBFR67_33090 [Nitrospira sp.]
MVDVGMGQQHGVDRAGIEAEKSVLSIRLLSMALEEAAVQQDTMTGHFQQMTTAGDGPDGAVKG